MKFVTENSVYELDLDNKRIRRLKGDVEPTSRQGDDKQWKVFLKISDITMNSRVIITWKEVDGIARCTVTSPVLKIILPSEAKL